MLILGTGKTFVQLGSHHFGRVFNGDNLHDLYMTSLVSYYDKTLM